METPFDYLEAKINGVSLSEAYKMGFKAGIKEVVDWMEKTGFNRESKGLFILWDEWQSKLKEWGTGYFAAQQDVLKAGYTRQPEPPAEPASGKDDERIYPCADCGKMRSKAEGGTTFTVCDECWDKRHPKNAEPDEGLVDTEKLAREILKLCQPELKVLDKEEIEVLQECFIANARRMYIHPEKSREAPVYKKLQAMLTRSR